MIESRRGHRSRKRWDAARRAFAEYLRLPMSTTSSCAPSTTKPWDTIFAVFVGPCLSTLITLITLASAGR